jgi:hypothetical protein
MLKIICLVLSGYNGNLRIELVDFVKIAKIEIKKIQAKSIKMFSSSVKRSFPKFM